MFSDLCFDWFDHHQLRCDRLHLHKKGLFPAFQRQEHRKSEINWEKMNGWQKLLPLRVLPQRQHFAKECPSLTSICHGEKALSLRIEYLPGPNHQKNYSHCRNSRTAPESSVYLPEVAWNKMWNTWLWIWTLNFFLSCSDTYSAYFAYFSYSDCRSTSSWECQSSSVYERRE